MPRLLAALIRLVNVGLIALRAAAFLSALFLAISLAFLSARYFAIFFNHASLLAFLSANYFFVSFFDFLLSSILIDSFIRPIVFLADFRQPIEVLLFIRNALRDALRFADRHLRNLPDLPDLRTRLIICGRIIVAVLIFILDIELNTFRAPLPHLLLLGRVTALVWYSSRTSFLISPFSLTIPT